MPRLVLAALLSLTLTASCRSLYDTGERLYIPDDGPWVVVFEADDGNQGIQELVPNGQTLANHREMLTQQIVDRSLSSLAPLELMRQLEAQMRKRCSDTTWTVLESDANSVLYEWSIRNCAGQPDQGELARIFRGTQQHHRVAYSHLYLPLPPERRAEWLELLRQTELRGPQLCVGQRRAPRSRSVRVRPIGSFARDDREPRSRSGPRSG